MYKCFIQIIIIVSFNWNRHFSGLLKVLLMVFRYALFFYYVFQTYSAKKSSRNCIAILYSIQINFHSVFYLVISSLNLNKSEIVIVHLINLEKFFYINSNVIFIFIFGLSISENVHSGNVL